MRTLGFALATTAALLASGGPVCAQDPGGVAGAAARLNVLRQVVDAVGAAGDAIGKLTDGVRKLLSAGTTGWDTLSARRTHQRLLDLSRLTSGLATEQTVEMMPGIQAYLLEPTPSNWTRLQVQVDTVLARVTDLLGRLDHERSDLVLQPAYVQLQRAVTARRPVLAQLRGMPPPRSKAEMKELRRLLTRYQVLAERLDSARDELNAYLRQPVP